MKDIILPKQRGQSVIEGSIRDVIAGRQLELLRELVLDEIAELKARGAQKIILGCTELSALFSDDDNTDLIDPLKLAVNEIFKETEC